jgi:hypothetical protein
MFFPQGMDGFTVLTCEGRKKCNLIVRDFIALGK